VIPYKLAEILIATPLFIMAVGMILYQLITGNVLTRNWKVDTTRRESPVRFWLELSIETLITGWLLFGFVRELVQPNR
jgi:hypothetical protein